MKRLSLAVSLAISMWACDGGSRSLNPISPSPPPAARPTYTLSGVVFEVTRTAQAPVEGVLVEEANSRHRVRTDQNGSFSISGLYATSVAVSVSKWGYDTETRQLTMSGDTQLDIQVVRGATYTLSGVVSEVTPTGHTPVEDVDVYCDACGEFGHTRVYTDTNGSYGFSGVYAGITQLLVRKEGYNVVGPTAPTVNGDTRFDIQLVRR